MNHLQAFESLDNSWSRDEILKKIKKGQNPDKIVNDFYKAHLDDFQSLNSFLEKQNNDIFDQIEVLSHCEIKLLNKIRENHKFTKNSIEENKYKQISLLEKINTFKYGNFMLNWSNKLVICSLIALTLISLTKQAWA